MTVNKDKLKVELQTIKLSQISANSGQTRGMGVIPQLMALGHGVFEKTNVEKDAIWPLLTSDKPDERKKAAVLLREHEPDIVDAMESQDQWGQLVPIRVVKLDDGTYDVIFGMTRCLARALGHAESSKEPDTIDAMVMDKGKLKAVDLKFMGFAENNDRRQESPIDKAIFFKECKDDFGLAPDDIGKQVGMTGQSVRDYLKMLHPKLEDKRMDIHEGNLSLDAAKKLLKKRTTGEGSEDSGNGAPSGNRARMHSIKKLDQALGAKKKPDWMEQKEWEMYIKEDVRRWIAFRLGKKYKPFTGEVLTVEEPKPEKPAEAAKKVLKLTLPKSLAVRLLVALGKADAETWDDKKIAGKLENIVNLVEAGQTLEDEKLNTLLQKLVKHYASGIVITIKAKAAAAAAA